MTDLENIEGFPDRIYETYNHGEGNVYVYVLELFSGRWYVGMSKYPKNRIQQHSGNQSVGGKEWTKIHPPVAVDRVEEFENREDAREREDELTVELAREKGPSNVRGGSWAGKKDTPPTTL